MNGFIGQLIIDVIVFKKGPDEAQLPSSHAVCFNLSAFNGVGELSFLFTCGFKTKPSVYLLVPVRQGNRRETSSQKGSDYSDAVIEFQEHLGYFLESRAEDSGEAEDLVFVPKAGNRSKVVAEVKYRSSDKSGLSPNDYVADFAKRFYQWEKGAYRGYEFNLFASKSANEQLWLDLFKRLKDDTVASFFDKMKEQSEGEYRAFLQKHEPSRFQRFLENSYIWIDYEIGDFERIIQRDDETDEYGYDPYSINYEAVPESGIHKTNLLQVVELPSDLYRIPAADGVTTGKFHAHDPNDILPVHYHNNDIYSLVHPDEFEEGLSRMCSDGSVETIPFRDIAVDDPSEDEINLSKVLIRGIVTTIADQIGAVVNRDRRDTRVYMEHDDEDLKVDGKWVTQQLDTGEVRHRSINVFVKFFNGHYFIGVFPTEEFTKDGRELVSGQRKKHLSDQFNTGKFPQNKRKSSTVEIWLSELALEQSMARFRLPSNLQDIQIERVEDLVLDGIRPPHSGDERNELVDKHHSGASDPKEGE